MSKYNDCTLNPIMKSDNNYYYIWEIVRMLDVLYATYMYQCSWVLLLTLTRACAAKGYCSLSGRSVGRLVG